MWPVGSGGSEWMYASSDGETRGCSAGLRYIGIQNPSHKSPIPPVTTNADCQPQLSASQGTTAGAATAPTFAPALAKPIASARSFFGNHSAIVFTAAG